MFASNKDHLRLLIVLTNPKGQIIAAILILGAIILFNSFLYIFRPYDGMGVYQEDLLGEVYEIYPGGPAAKAGVQVGDRILAIDGKPVDVLRSGLRYRPGIKAGDAVHYKFQRGNEQIDLTITMGRYSENPTLLGAFLGIQFLSFGLWIIGLVLAFFVPSDDVRARLLGLGFLIAGLTAAVGGASGWNGFWGANTIQKVLLTFLAPILVAAHLTFPEIIFQKYRKRIIYTIFLIAGLLSILIVLDDLILTPKGYSLSLHYGIHLRQWVLLIFIVSWFIAVVLLFTSRFRSPDPEIRRQTGIIIWGMGLGIGPFFVLTLLPYILFGEEYVAGAYTILALILLPLAYAYVIFQRKLLKVDFIINRIVVWFTLILLILIASTLVFGVFVAIFNLPLYLPIYIGLAATLIVLPFATLSRVVQEQVNRILYGSHYDYLTVTSNMSKQLAQTLDRDCLVELLTEQLAQQMGIRRAALLLTDGYRIKSVGMNEKQISYSLDDDLCMELKRQSSPIRSIYLSMLPISAAMSDWAPLNWGQVYAPLIFGGDLQGILVLGQRLNGDVYGDQDLSIIATVAEQGALAAANVFLFEKQRNLAQQLVRSEEDERKRLASDLHDTILQDLFFIKQGLHKDPTNSELVIYLEECIQNLRRMIKAQRPPLLDQGLPLALQGLIDDMKKIAGPETTITWKSTFNGVSNLSDDQATSIFRIAQEALNNAVKHANARNIKVRLEQSVNRVVCLLVSDDGIGASWIHQNGNLDNSHFGLVLMQERALMIDAKLRIFTLPGEGTSVELEVNP